MGKKNKFKIAVFGAATLFIVVLALALEFKRTNEVGTQPEATEAKPNSGAVQTVELLNQLNQRYAGVLARAEAVKKELVRSKESGIPYPIKSAEVLLNLGIQGLQMKISSLSENPTAANPYEADDAAYADLFDAYLFYVAGVQGLNLTAHRMKAKLGKSEIQTMKMLAALNIARRYSQSLRGGWVKVPQNRSLASKELSDLTNFRNWIVYDWKVNFSQDDRLKIARGTHLYFDSVFANDSLKWGERVLKSQSKVSPSTASPLAQNMTPDENQLTTSLLGALKPLR